MASHVEVISTDFRRAKVKVSPGTFMIDVKNEACEKLNLSPDKYQLKQKQKNVDLTSPWRTTGLSAGAKLELVVKSNSPSVVTVRVDVQNPSPSEPPVQRSLDKIPSSMTLWQVLRQVEEGSDRKVITTARATPRMTNRLGAGMGSGLLYWDSPVVNIMGREYATLPDLQKTLSQCGIDGSSNRALLRVSFKTTDKTLGDAMKEAYEYMKELEKPVPAAHTESETAAATSGVSETAGSTSESTENVPTPASNAAGQANSDAMDIEPQEAQPTSGETTTDVTTDPLQPTSVFSAPSSATPAAALIQDDESLYQPTIAHAQLHQQHLQQRTQNKRLKSDAEIAAEQAERTAKLATVKQVAAKVRFPDGTSAQWVVGQEHTGSFLYSAVRSVMRFPSEPFRLVVPGWNAGKGLTVADSEEPGSRLIGGYGFKGNVLMNLLWEASASDAARKEPFLKNAIASRAQEIVVPEVPQGDDGEEASSSALARPQPTQQQPSDGKASVKIPKWLKLGGGKK